MEDVAFPISWSNEDAKPEVWGNVDSKEESPVQGDTEQGEDIYNPPSFEDQNFGPPNFILLSRIYDLLAVIAMKINPEEAEFILDEHEAGRIVSDPPFLDFEADVDND